MNVTTITVPKAEAEAKLKEYRRYRHAGVETEYGRILRAYEEATKGRPLLILSPVIADAPRDDKGRPMLSIARADQKQVRVWAHDRADNFNIIASHRLMHNAQVRIERPGPPPSLTKHREALRAKYVATYGEKKVSENHWWWNVDTEGFSLVPIVPPSVARGHDLSKRFVLWEVNAWADKVIGARPDKDPYLLQRVGDDLYAVVGEWDLTPLEQAIMRDRARDA